MEALEFHQGRVADALFDIAVSHGVTIIRFGDSVNYVMIPADLPMAGRIDLSPGHAAADPECEEAYELTKADKVILDARLKKMREHPETAISYEEARARFFSSG